jgi:uncharacterized protein YdhG (YjbR/CyaY superfamily)
MLAPALSRSRFTQAGVSFYVPSKPKTIDDYLASVPAARRRALEALRALIHGIVPGIEECISYSMPAFRHDGHVVAGFLATAKGCSYFPFSGATLATLEPELRAYSRTKSALHFESERPLPKTLVAKLLKTRIAETRVAQTQGRRPAAPARSVERAAPKVRAARPAKASPRASRAQRAAPKVRAAGPAKASPRASRTKQRSR